MRFFTLDLLVGVSLVLGAAAGLACSSQGDDCEANKSCGSSGGGSGGTGAGGSGATGGAGGDGGACDTSKSPSAEACLVNDQYAIFVSPDGTDGAEGTKTDPLKSITEAVTKAAGTKVILVCNGNYDEHVLVNAGAKIYGGFDCSSWSYSAAAKPTVAPSDVGYALEVDSVAVNVVIEDIQFRAKDGSAAAVSSIAAFVKNSSSITLRRVKIDAGAGAPGTSGVLTSFTFPKTAAQLDGDDATGNQGGLLNENDCPAGDTSIGGGGANGPTAKDGDPGSPALGGGAAGKAGITCAGPGTGGDGSPGTSPPSASGATTLGALSAAGWTPSDGESGPPGGVGQGGGGGASSANGGGGGGATGSCGGAGGPGGKGGGASIALLSLTSTVSVEDSDLVASDAGDGGAGAGGQPGQSEIGGGGAAGGANACAGGPGGPGGNGAAGGGGAGGVSAAIAYKGGQPTVAGGTMMAGAKGDVGIGGIPATNDGVDGTSGNQVPLP